MPEFIKGKDLCRHFFFEAAKPVIEKNFPGLIYSAGLIGYGSDVLGYDDPVSRDHMWGPRFYMFLDRNDIHMKNAVLSVLREELPYTFMGYSVNFTKPDPHDNGVRHPEYIDKGIVDPLIFIMTFDDFLLEQLGSNDIDAFTSADWLSFSEHRLLSLVNGEFFHDGLDLISVINKLQYYPETVRTYLACSCWEIIASEQAFMKRCFDVGDDIGSRIITARICDRLMRLCFIYSGVYAPYSKWFGRAFLDLSIPQSIVTYITTAVSASDIDERENTLTAAQLAVAKLHNSAGITEQISCEAEYYYGRNIKVIFPEKISDACREKLLGTELENTAMIGSFSQIGGLSDYSDDITNRSRIKELYQ